MQISRNSRLCRFAYSHNRFQASLDGKEFQVPHQTNLCRFFWRVVLLAPICLIGIGVVSLLAFAVASTIFFSGILAIPFGYRPNLPWKWVGDSKVAGEAPHPWGRIENWPAWLTFSGKRILPGVVATLLFLGWRLVPLSQLLWKRWTTLALDDPMVVYSISGFLVLIGIVFLAAFWFKVVKGSEFHMMCREFFKNKVKGNICPIISFVESPSNEETQTD